MFPLTQAELDAADTDHDGTLSTHECAGLCGYAVGMVDSVDTGEIVTTDTGTGQAVHCTGTWRKWCYD